MGFPRTGNGTVGENVFVIAEIGKNFIQSEAPATDDAYLENAKALVDAAAESGADAAKFQTHTVDDEQRELHVVSPHFSGSDRYTWVKRNADATPLSFWKEVQEHCQKRGILFFTTPMSRGALRKIAPLDPPFWKVSSADVHDHVMLREMLRTKKPIIISTGMVSYKELDATVKYLEDVPELGILYCISQYPAPKESFNLSSIERFAKLYPHAVIGFSDHSLGHEAALAAIKTGARIIEKHFSLSRDFWGSDHKVSMTPKEMETMVKAIRNRSFEHCDASPYMGNPEKELEGATNAFRPYFGKILVAARDLPEESVLDEEAIYAMRPALDDEGMLSNRVEEVLGKKVAKSLKKYDAIISSILH